MKNLISVIIPVHNAAQTLDACMASILAQRYDCFEVILVDDGSSDNSLAHCHDFAQADKRISVIALPHSGVSRARNAGIEQARGDYMLFIDADDTITPHCLQTLAEAAGKADILFFPHALRHPDGLEVAYSFPPVDARTPAELWNAVHWLKHNRANCNFFGYTWNKLFRADIIRENGLHFVPGLRISEDEVFTADYCLHARSLAHCHTLFTSTIYRTAD